jgi:ribosomal protein S12 methylthiotransferase
MRSGKINIVTLGCSKNVVDSEKLLRQLKEGGYTLTWDPDNTSADTVIINTCGFIGDAKEESIDTILRFVRAKEEGRIRNLYVMGCLSERYKEQLMKEIPEVDRYFGVKNITDILNETGISYQNNLLTSRILTSPGHYAYLKVSEGCDRTCAFCSIPLIRGKCISRPLEELVKEADELADSGVKEIILIAQDLSYYGLDLYKRNKLTDLLRELLKLNRFEWIRLHYLYPAGFPDDLIGIIQDNQHICKYIDIPIQHISDNMLKLMRRSYGRGEAEEILYRLRDRLPDAVIRTTLIAGHPGETENDYLELRRFIREFRFDRLGVFAYSHEEGTYSFDNYKDEIPDSVKESRVSELMEIQQAISAEKNESLIGKIFKVLIDKREEEYFTGRTEYDSPEVDQEVLIPVQYDLKPGNFYNIRIVQSAEFDLFGKPV